MAEPLEALIPKTQELLQPLVPKPKLADKLLSKPPFRFLHDVFAAVTQTTGFAKGLYTPFEQDSANLKEKHHKVAYLDKMIVCVGQTLGRDVDVRAAKIVAGLEPENTNLLLQALAQAAGNTSLDWAKAVQAALAKVPSLTADGAPAVAAPAPEAKTAEAPAPAAASAERPASKEKSSGDAEKAAAVEAKAKEKAKREEAERKAEAQRQDAEAKAATEAASAAAAAPAESKGGGSGSNSRSSSSSSSRAAKQPPPDNNSAGNNQIDEVLLQSIKECNGDVERTKEMIEKVISKPKMSAKLLSKPPFRFLHDIVSEITRVTGFADGLYTGEELDSAAIKDKGPKMDYLNKIMLCVSCHLNVEIDAKAAKIVAGLEPDDTNKFLQLLALACRAGSSAEAVQRVLSGDTAVRPGGAAKMSSGATGHAKVASEQREATPEAKLSSRSSTPQESKSRREAAEEKQQQQPSPPATTSSTPQAPPGSFAGPVKPLTLPTNDHENGDENANLTFGSKDEEGGMGSTAPGTSGGMGTSRTSRPTTARRRPPKLKENVTEVGRLLVHDTKVASVVGIMKDGDNNDSDDEGAGDADENNNSSGSTKTPSLALEGGAHGRLVRDILKDQNAEEEQARKQREEEEQANEVETGIRLGRRKKSLKHQSKGSASNLAEMTELRNNIQKICQATNPVGKGIEFVHEDLDAMSKELEYWKKEYTKKRDAYEEEKKKTEEALQPLQMQLLEVDEQIKEQIHKINSLKATIAKNEEKTQKLLRMVVSA